MTDWGKLGGRLGILAGGVLLGSYGTKILASKDAKKVYTHCTAAVLRMKDEVMKDVETIRENAGDIAADAEAINEKRRQDEEAQMIADAKAVLAEAEAKAEAAAAAGAQA